jgi:hypothetical protein
MNDTIFSNYTIYSYSFLKKNLISFISPLITVPYQTYVSIPIETYPTTVAFGATKPFNWIWGFRSYRFKTERCLDTFSENNGLRTTEVSEAFLNRY